MKEANQVISRRRNGHSLHVAEIACLLSVFLTACAGMGPEDNRRLQLEVAGQLNEGMTLGTSIARLTKLGFACDDKSAAPAVTCTRNGGSGFVHSCLDRVNLSTDGARTSVARIEVAPIACAGL
jgi:hypothetical protein